MLLRLPHGLHYPITVTSFIKSAGDEVSQNEAIFWYSYRSTTDEIDGLGNRVDVERKYPARFESPVDGIIEEWKVSRWDVITGPVDLVEITEPCSHEVQFGGMCAECGKDMTGFTYNTQIQDAMRAPIQMSHDNTTLTVSAKEASRVEEDAKRRLLASRRLSLVVDLDQTIIHATVDPTVGEWKEDKENPNYEALRDVRQFQLIDDGPGMHGCWYYIKLRPGLEEFLREVAQLYELHIYTMGTRAYAQNIADIIDPTRELFGDRILSRDESGSLTAKNLQRLFPVDTKMVVIMDDRGDVWRWNANLIKVTPYDFFVGIGDINSSFLPEKQELPSADDVTKKEKDQKPDKPQKKETGSEVSALEQLVTMGGGDNPKLLLEQTSAQEEKIMQQVEDRPLLQKQKLLDAEDDALASTSDSTDSIEEFEPSKNRHHLLEDNDRELYHLRERLENVHSQFFDQYDQQSRKIGGRVATLRGEKASKDRDVDLKFVPDVKDIMPAIKREVLGKVVLIFSGVLPLGTDTQNADISLWAKSFGATIASKISTRTTHLVAGRNRTAKVREATRYPNLKIVTTQWLLDSLTNWRLMDEEPYLLTVHPDDRGEPISPSQVNMESSYLSSSEEGDTESDALFDDAGLDATSPIGYDAKEQAEVHDELKDFLGSDDESESDNESTIDPDEETKKRKRGATSNGDGSAEYDPDDEDMGSRLSQRIKRSYERSTSLREVASANSAGTAQSFDESAATSQADMDSETDMTGAVNYDVDDEDELEREMLAAFEDGGGSDEGGTRTAEGGSNEGEDEQGDGDEESGY
ncbi:hypothetical protein N7495_008073 [Penicillium taxi]|uniref:uncharacterized protein n=1 Tax=Penicillium taxi TaxID=168475 RepID=UPI002545899B|nr:uncharacterized protein N7495_008073 [Penicillium taxi]KAJ5888032.1 hypothetical protein N7495_008073 [Penicillium taxi]